MFNYLDSYGRGMLINISDPKQVDAIKGKVFKRRAWSETAPLRFALYVPRCGGKSYFAYCDEYGKFKNKTGHGYNNKGDNKGNEFSTVGESVLNSTDIIEVIKKEKKMAKAELTTTINVVGATISVDEKITTVERKTSFETKPKWLGVWYSTTGDHIKTLPYVSKKDAHAELKLHTSRKLVMYKMDKVVEIDFPIKETEV